VAFNRACGKFAAQDGAKVRAANFFWVRGIFARPLKDRVGSPTRQTGAARVLEMLLGH
jgi:hypothetical protein